LEIPEVSKFLHSIKTFPNHVAAFQRFFEQKPACTKTKMAGSRPFQCLESGFISANAERRDLSGSVKFFKIKETAFQKLTCSI
jgi:hypothetical protein